MGACTTFQNKCSKLNSIHSQPLDTANLANIKLPTLHFKGKLSNVKLKNSNPYDKMKLSIKFEIDEQQSIFLTDKIMNEDGVIKWKTEYQFIVALTEYEMRKKFIIITCMNSKKQIIGSMKVNLYLISIGPYHQDYHFFLKESQNSRISFNLQISQIIIFKCQILRVQMHSIQKLYPKDTFTFSILPIITMTTKIPVLTSSAVSVPSFDEKDKISSVKNNDGQNYSVIWEKQSKLPYIQNKISVQQIHSAYLHLIFWKQNSFPEQESNILDSECYISLGKLLQREPIILYDSKQMHSYEERNFDLSENNQLHGKNIGISKIKLKFIVQAHIKQMKVCVLTEIGIQQTSLFFKKDISKNSKIKQIAQISEQIQSEFVTLCNNQSERYCQYVLQRSVSKIADLMKKQINQLKISHKQSKKIYIYKDQKDFLKGQNVLVDLGFKLVSYIKERNDQLTQLCWEMLSVLMKRGQFSLAYIGYSSSEKLQISSLNISKNLRNKIKVSLKFQALLNKILERTLQSLNQKGHEKQTKFVEEFCAFAYFTITEFRKRILKIISRQNDPIIDEWRGIQFSLYDQIQEINEGENTFWMLFDWENNFYKCISKDKCYKQNCEQLQVTLKDNQWQNRMQKRSGAFFSFIEYWVDYIVHISIDSRNVYWKYFPGYNKILRSFLVELKVRSISLYPQTLKNACRALLINEKLINSFIMIILKKTKIYDRVVVIKSLQMVNIFLSTLKLNDKKIPHTFDYKFFTKAMKIALQNQCAFVSNKCLLLLFNNFTVFSIGFQTQFSLYLLGKMFFKLFLHWSFNVRKTFHHLIIRIYSTANLLVNKENLQQILFSQKVKVRFQKLLNLLQQIQIKKEKRDMDFRIIQLDKNLYIRMKKKMKFKQNTKKELQVFDIRDEVFESQKINKISNRSSIFIDGASLQEKNKQKSYSNQINVNLKKAIENAKNNDKNNYIIKKTAKKELFLNITSQKDNKISRHKSESKSKHLLNLIDQIQMQIQQVSGSQIQYITKSMEQFKQINSIMIQHILQNDNSNNIPSLNLISPFDQGQMRPQNQEDW